MSPRPPAGGAAPPTAPGRPAGAALCAAALLLLAPPAAGASGTPGAFHPALPPEASAAAPAPEARDARRRARQDAARQDAPADSSELDARTARVADQLRCPVCRSQSVLESSSTLAREMKGEIRRRLAEGHTPEQVKAYFVSRYGDWILLRPEPEGLNLVVYVLPPLLLVGGGLLVWALLRRWGPRAPAASDSHGGDRGASPLADDESTPGNGLSEDEERRLEEALRERT